MERPKIEDLMPEGTTFTDMHRKFRDNPELYRYICALDLYIDELEEALGLNEPFVAHGKLQPHVVLMYGEDLEKNQEEKPEKEPYKSKFQKRLDEAMAKGEEAKKSNQ